MGLLTNALRMQTDYVTNKERNQATIDAAKENARANIIGAGIRGLGTEAIKYGLPLLTGYALGKGNNHDDRGSRGGGGKMTKAEAEQVFEKMTQKTETTRTPNFPPSVYGMENKPKQLTPMAQRVVDKINEKPLGRWLVNDAFRLPTSSNSKAWSAAGALGATGSFLTMVPVL